MIPSIARIATRLEDALSREHGPERVRAAAKKIRAAMENYSVLEDEEKALYAISQLLGGYGVEVVRDRYWYRYYGDIGLVYVNMGDTYTATVIYDTRARRFRVDSLGDVIERNPRRFAV